MDGMKTIGLIGGLSWYSTTAYYKVINEQVQGAAAATRRQRSPCSRWTSPAVRDMQQRGAWDEAGALLADAGRRCEAAGADLLLICSNLMHRVADEVQDAVDIPLLRITDAIAARARAEGHDTLGCSAPTG